VRFQRLNDYHQVGDGAGEPIQLGDHEDVVLPDVIHGGVQLFSFGDRGYLLLKDLLATGRREFSQLCLEAGGLVDGGGSGIADDHRRSQESLTF
jgi:hypothetical protein